MQEVPEPTQPAKRPRGRPRKIQPVVEPGLPPPEPQSPAVAPTGFEKEGPLPTLVHVQDESIVPSKSVSVTVHGVEKPGYRRFQTAPFVHQWMSEEEARSKGHYWGPIDKPKTKAAERR